MMRYRAYLRHKQRRRRVLLERSSFHLLLDFMITMMLAAVVLIPSTTSFVAPPPTAHLLNPVLRGVVLCVRRVDRVARGHRLALDQAQAPRMSVIVEWQPGVNQSSMPCTRPVRTVATDHELSRACWLLSTMPTVLPGAHHLASGREYATRRQSQARLFAVA